MTEAHGYFAADLHKYQGKPASTPQTTQYRKSHYIAGHISSSVGNSVSTQVPESQAQQATHGTVGIRRMMGGKKGERTSATPCSFRLRRTLMPTTLWTASRTPDGPAQRFKGFGIVGSTNLTTRICPIRLLAINQPALAPSRATKVRERGNHEDVVYAWRAKRQRS
ncbi:hypothetical protein BC567DRAFT_225837 [Phyllosticta citribraziliensis]